MSEISEEEKRKIFQSLCLEEYKALRAESVRCMQLISNTIWIGLSGYVITLGATGAVLKAYPNFLPLSLVLLAMQAFSASVMFLSEVRKYARVGIYIRDKIERTFFPEDHTDISRIPLYWEHWLSGRRTRLFYIVSLFVLQLPILGILTLRLSPVLSGYFPSTGLLHMGQQLSHDVVFQAATVSVVLFDATVVAYFVWRIQQLKYSGL